jgi:hypothetical protein
VAWIALEPAASASNAVSAASTPGDGSFFSHITLTLTLIVLFGIVIILAQSYLGKRRHKPEWIDELEAEEQLREQEREARMTIRGTAPGDDTEAETTRQLLERVAQLRGMGSSPASAEGEEARVPLSVHDAIEAARRVPERYQEPEDTLTAPGVSKGTIDSSGEERAAS